MRKLFILSLSFIILSCKKNDDGIINICKFDYDKGGSSKLNTNFGNFTCNASFRKRNDLIDSLDYMSFLSSIQSNYGCYHNAQMEIQRIPYSLDTFYLKSKYSYDGIPYYHAYFSYLDDLDASKERYILMDDKKYKSWVKLDSINKDTSVIYGKFNLSLYLSNQKFNPNSPDTLYVKDGVFRAVLF
jgi:hypothetical protein